MTINFELYTPALAVDSVSLLHQRAPYTPQRSTAGELQYQSCQVAILGGNRFSSKNSWTSSFSVREYLWRKSVIRVGLSLRR